jgi:hypothetical protein
MNRALSLLPFVIFSGCVSIQIKKPQVIAAKKVAIVAYTGSLQLEDTTSNSNRNAITGNIGAAKGMADLTSGRLGARRKEQAVVGRDELGKRLATLLGWELLPTEAFAASPDYQQAVSKSHGLGRQATQNLDGVLLSYELSRFKPDQLAAIATAIGADALITVQLTYNVGKTGGVSVGGFGSTTKFPVATAQFTVYDKAGQIIWSDSYARGAVATQGLRNTMGADVVENETEVLEEAANFAFDKIILNYQSYEEPKK